MIYIKKAVLPDCPYCGGEVSYLESFIIKNRPLYKCRYCGKKSAVNLDSVIYNIIGLLQVVCIVVFLLSATIGGGFALFGIFVIILFFVGFYSISPFMVLLEKPERKKKKVRKRKKLQENIPKKIEKKLDGYDFTSKYKKISDDMETNSGNVDPSDRDIFSN